MSYTPDSKFGILRKDSRFAPVFRSVFYFEKEYDGFDELSIRDVCFKYGYGQNDDAELIVKVINDSIYNGIYHQFDPNRPFVGVYDFSIPNPKGTLIVCPGGAYANVCCSQEGFDTAIEANKHGYSAFVVVYGIGSNAIFPQAQDDLANAIKFVYDKKNNFSLTDDYSVIGFSAAGHLVGLYGSKKYGYSHYGLKKPKHLILNYPVITLSESTHGDSRFYVTGGDESKYDELSVEKNVDESYPSTFICRGLIDVVVPTTNSDLLAKALFENGVKFRYEVVEDDMHGYAMGIGRKSYGWFDRAISFINE